MISAPEMKKFAREAAAIVSRDRGVAQFEIYCSSSADRIARLNYTSDIPCRGVEELKSHAVDGFQIRIVKRSNPHEIGGAFEAGDLSTGAIRDVLARAHRAAVIDPHFPGFPAEPRKFAAAKPGPGDLSRVSDAELVKAAWSVIRAAVSVFGRSDAARNPNPGLVLGGDLTLLRDRIAVANSNFADIRTDEGARFSSSVTALVEAMDAKGTASAMGSSLADLKRAAARMGRDAVSRALHLRSGIRPAHGEYRVVLGPQPLAEIVNYMVLGSLTTGAFHAASSAYHGRFGSRIMDRRLSLMDDPAMRRGGVTRRISCEGIGVRRIDLVKDGKLVGLFSNFYDSHRLATDENRNEKLGAQAGTAEFPPLSGYRISEGGSRRFDQHPGAAGTNVVMRARGGVDDAELVRAVGNGLYIGRVWYTYPINGQRAGDFTCTVSGDSFLIRDGKIAEPLAPNSLRVNSNIENVFNRVIAAGSRSHPAIVWGSAEAFYVPALALEALAVSAVGA